MQTVVCTNWSDFLNDKDSKLMMDVKNLIHPNIEASMRQPLSFSIESSTLFCIIGENGTGKSTLLKILAGLLAPQNGKIISFQKNVYLGEKFGLKAKSTIQSFLNIYEKKPFNKIFSFIPKLKLSHFKHKIEILSSGQKMLLNFYRIHQSNKKIWLLDEPFRFLDTRSKQKVKSWIIDHIQTEGSVVLTDHSLHLFQEEIHTQKIKIQILNL